MAVLHEALDLGAAFKSVLYLNAFDGLELRPKILFRSINSFINIDTELQFLMSLDTCTHILAINIRNLTKKYRKPKPLLYLKLSGQHVLLSGYFSIRDLSSPKPVEHAESFWYIGPGFDQTAPDNCLLVLLSLF